MYRTFFFNSTYILMARNSHSLNVLSNSFAPFLDAFLRLWPSGVAALRTSFVRVKQIRIHHHNERYSFLQILELKQRVCDSETLTDIILFQITIYYARKLQYIIFLPTLILFLSFLFFNIDALPWFSSC